MPPEITQGLDYCIQVIVSHRAVDKTDVVNVNGVQFLDVVVQFEQSIENGGIRHAGSVAQHAHLGLGKELVTQCQDIVHDPGKLGVGSGLAVTCKGQHVGFGPIGLHLGKGRA